MAGKGETIVIKKKKGGGGHGHHGGAWKVAYADFVTAMMAFFLVMWLMGSDEETKSAISHYFNQPNTPFKSGADPKSNMAFPLGDREGQGESILSGMEGQLSEDLVQHNAPVKPLMQETKSISRMLEDHLEGKIYGMDISDSKMKFSLPENILFRPGSAELSNEAKENLDIVGQLLRSFSGYLTIEGHADENIIKGGKYSNNWELSMGRALAVMQYLVQKQGLDERRLIPVGAGSRRKVAKNGKGESVQKNRRVQFILGYDDPSSE